MFFLVCFHCVEIFTQEEGHCCPFSEGNESEIKSDDIAIVRAETVDLERYSTSSKDESINNQWLRKIKRLTIGDFKFSIVESETDEKTSNKECRTTKNDVCDSKEATRTESTDIFHPIAQESRKASTELYTHPAFPENVAHHLRQLTESKINNFTSTLNTRAENYPAVSQHTFRSSGQFVSYKRNEYTSTPVSHMECQTTYNNVCSSNEISSTENPHIFHRFEPEPRNTTQQSFIPQLYPEMIAQNLRHYVPHETNKNASTLNTLTAESPAFFGRETRSTWNKYVSTQGTHTEESRAVPNMADHSSSLQKELKDESNASVQGIQVIETSLLQKKRRGFTCQKCGSCFERRKLYEVHVESNCDPKPYKCDKCDSAFPTKKKLYGHSICHGEKIFKCDKCVYVCNYKWNLKTHMRSQHKN